MSLLGGFTMKKLIFMVGCVLILLTGCNLTNDRVKITTDRNSYTPTMSSAQGIKMTPTFESINSYAKLIYHWKTDEGEFIGLGNDVKNQGEPVIWSAIENDEVVDIMQSFDIELEVIDSVNNKILATAKVTINPDKGFYIVKGASGLTSIEK